MIISTERTIRTIMASPRFQNIQSAFAVNRAMHLQGAAVTVHCNRLLLMTIDQDRTIKYLYFYALGSKVSINDQIFTVAEFWRFLAAKHPPPRTHIRADSDRTTRPTRAFATPDYSQMLDFTSLFAQDHIQIIRDFDMDDIGRFKIRTVKSVQTKDVPAYTRIISSALPESYRQQSGGTWKT